MAWELKDLTRGAAEFLSADNQGNTPAGRVAVRLTNSLDSVNVSLSNKQKAGALYLGAAAIGAVVACIPGMQAPAAAGLAVALGAIKAYAVEKGASSNIQVIGELAPEIAERVGSGELPKAEKLGVYLDKAASLGLSSEFLSYAKKFEGGELTGEQVLEQALHSAIESKRKLSRQWEVKGSEIVEHVFPSPATLRAGYYATREEAEIAASAYRVPLIGLKKSSATAPIASTVIFRPSEYASFLAGKSIPVVPSDLEAARKELGGQYGLVTELASALEGGVDRGVFFQFWRKVSEGSVVPPSFIDPLAPVDGAPVLPSIIVDSSGIARILFLTKENPSSLLEKVTGNLILGTSFFPSSWYVVP